MDTPHKPQITLDPPADNEVALWMQQKLESPGDLKPITQVLRDIQPTDPDPEENARLLPNP